MRNRREGESCWCRPDHGVPRMGSGGQGGPNAGPDAPWQHTSEMGGKQLALPRSSMPSDQPLHPLTGPCTSKTCTKHSDGLRVSPHPSTGCALLWRRPARAEWTTLTKLTHQAPASSFVDHPFNIEGCRTKNVPSAWSLLFLSLEQIFLWKCKFLGARSPKQPPYILPEN